MERPKAQTNMTPEEEHDKLAAVQNANYDAQGDLENMIKNTNPNKKNSMIPTPPGPGEIMHCQICGQEMLPKNFSKDVKMRKREFKWQMHEYCMNYWDHLADIQTPGLLAERKGKAK